MADQSGYRPIDLRENPYQNSAEAHNKTVETLAEYVKQFPEEERAAVLASVAAQTASLLEASAEPGEAATYQMLGFHTIQGKYPDFFS